MGFGRRNRRNSYRPRKRRGGMGKLSIMFTVGALLAGIPALILFSGTVHIANSFFTLVIPMGIGFALLLISGTKALKKFNRYLDK
mgnify:CR=1 FL=1|tara:strand:+ start:95 stop:349 length:255 start_codon:yes stop_codon:yes gene_type:complete